jgi:uncharacterized protein (TIGR04255 family)
MTVKFRNPPVNEVVIGAYFTRDLHPMRAEHVGLFWSSVRPEFPTIQQQPIVVSPVGAPNLMIEFGTVGEMFPLPRFWLESPNGETLIQIQRNAFLLNWRKKEGRYPHFETVKKSFDRNFALFMNFLQKELSLPEPEIQVSELTYINLIEGKDYWRGPLDTERILPKFQLPLEDSTGISPAEFNFQVTQRFATDLSVSTSIRSGRNPQTGMQPALVLEFRGIGALGAASKVDADAWFERAHETIGNCFVTTTSPEIQERYWERIDHAS